MVIIVTGAIGSGKTTVCRKLIEKIKNQGYTCGGVVTYKAPDKSIVVEEVGTGERKMLASMDNIYGGPRTPRYFFNPEGIEFGIQAINRGMTAEFLVVDEVGQLELGGEGFSNALEIIRSGKAKGCILVVRSNLLPAFQSRLGNIPLLVFETNMENRDRLPDEIASLLLEEYDKDV